MGEGEGRWAGVGGAAVTLVGYFKGGSRPNIQLGCSATTTPSTRDSINRIACLRGEYRHCRMSRVPLCYKTSPVSVQSDGVVFKGTTLW